MQAVLRVSRRRDFRVVVALPTRELPAVHYASRASAIRGAVWHARSHPHAVIKVQRFDHVAGKYVGVTQTVGEALR